MSGGTMISKHDAIKLIQDIQNGRWDRHSVDVPKGNIAIRLWDDSPEFSLGMEYGAISILMFIFGLSKDDL